MANQATIIRAVQAHWPVLRQIAEQQAYWMSPHRFNVVPAGRRSGKTALAKRKLVLRAMCAPPGSRFFAAAPTRDQAKRIYWTDLKKMVPKELQLGKPSESELVIRLINGVEIHVVGLDKPERIEGSPWDGGVLDEYGNIKKKAWTENIRPALSDRLGWCDMIGVPEGRNHYYHTAEKAKAKFIERGEKSLWNHFHWTSAQILPPEEIQEARESLDPLTFQQEYEASFISFEGRAYYNFTDENKAKLFYDPNSPIGFCFDFNVNPGVAAVVQEQRLPNGLKGTGVIGEVHIPRNSNTERVCARLIQDWKGHQSAIYLYGDATGGAPGSAKVLGSDWDIIKRCLRAGDAFGDRIVDMVPRGNPPERVRVNSVNTRICNGAGERHLMVDPTKAPNVALDFEGTPLLEGGSGEIDKKKDKTITHLSDAVGYYIEKEFSIKSSSIYTGDLEGV